MSDETETYDEEQSEPKEERVRVSVKRKRKPVTVELEDGSEVDYEVVELIGTERDAYLNIVESKIAIVGGQRKLRDYKGVATELLKRTVRDQNGSAIPPKIIDAWPSSMQNALAAIARDLSALDEEDVEEEGND